MNRVIFAGLLLGGVLLASSGPAFAQTREAPYWASLSADKVNMRVGPARDYRISWIYRREDLPVKVVRLHEGWRLVEDPNGARGWILSRFLSRERTAIVQEQVAEMVERPGGSKVLWRLERGVVGQLAGCQANWCRLEVHGKAGFVAASDLWGDGNP